MTGYTPLFSSIVASTIWRESKETKIVWITLLALCDSRGIVEASIPGLADLAKVTIDECKQAIEKLMAPDEYSRTKDHEGRRIIEIDGGWKILNHAKFREKSRQRAGYMREYRAKKAVTNVTVCNHMLPMVTDTNANANANSKELSASQRSNLPSPKLEERKTPPLPPSSGIAVDPSGAVLSIVSPPSGDEAFWDEIKSLYTWLDLDRERAKMKAWLLTPRGKGRKLTKRFVINWLNKCDKPLETPKPRIVV